MKIFFLHPHHTLLYMVSVITNISVLATIDNEDGSIHTRQFHVPCSDCLIELMVTE